MKTITGKASTFGGPHDDPDSGNKRSDWRSEGLALFQLGEEKLPKYRHLFLPEMPDGMSGLARQIDPNSFYIACRWDEDRFFGEAYNQRWLRDKTLTITNLRTGRSLPIHPVDYGPGKVPTSRGINFDLSPGAARALAVKLGPNGDVLELQLPISVDEPTEQEITTGNDPRDRPVPGGSSYTRFHKRTGTSVIGRILPFLFFGGLASKFGLGSLLTGASGASGLILPEILSGFKSLLSGGLLGFVRNFLGPLSPFFETSEKIERDNPGAAGEEKKKQALLVLDPKGGLNLSATFWNFVTIFITNWINGSNDLKPALDESSTSGLSLIETLLRRWLAPENLDARRE